MERSGKSKLLEGRFALGGVLATLLAVAVWLFGGVSPSLVSAQEDFCPNAQIRSQQNAQHLPGCRAYEQVSPIDKNGNHIGIRAAASLGAQTISRADGNSVTFGSAGAFAGSPSSLLTGAYGGTRAGGTWNTSPFNPPLYTANPAFIAAGLSGLSADFSKQLVGTTAALTPEATESNYNVYVHDSTDGSYEFAADTTFNNQQNAVFAGGASDGSSFLFALQQVGFGAAKPYPDSTPSVAGGQNNFFEYSDGELKLVGVLPDGSASPGGSLPAAPAGSVVQTVNGHIARHPVSVDGSRAYWKASATASPIYLRENDQTTVVSRRESDDSTQNGSFQHATSDGDHAFFLSSGLLTSDASPSGDDLYRYDADSDDIIDLTATGTSAGVQGVLGISEDGDYVYFQATGDLAIGATAGQSNLYVWHEDEIRFIGTLSASLPNVNRSVSNDWRVSPNGQHLLFLTNASVSGPNPQPAQPAKQAYIYRYADDSMDCASCVPGGTPTSNVELKSQTVNTSLISSIDGLSRNLLDSGTVYFQTSDALVARDTNSQMDVYGYADGEIYLISSGASAEQSLFGDVSPDGSNVFFLTTESLVSQDIDSLYDLYDARVDGGLHSQMPVKGPQCQSDACQGPVIPPSAPINIGSVGFVGNGNVPLVPGPVRVFVGVSKLRAVVGSVARLRVRVPAAGRISVAGSSVRRTNKSASRAGIYSVRITLSSKAKKSLKKRKRLKVNVQVSYRAKDGQSVSKTIKVTFKQPKAKQTKTRKGGR